MAINEKRARHYEEELSQHVEKIVIKEADHLSCRYDPWLEKALKKMRHSKSVWAAQKMRQDAKAKEIKEREHQEKR